MSRSKSPWVAARREEREHRRNRPNRVAIWTIAVIIALGASVFIVLFLKHPPEADGEHGHHTATNLTHDPEMHR